jgi:hypothetical protein
VTPETTTFEGLRCIGLPGEGSTLLVTTSVGPRIIGLTGAGHSLLAVLPEATLERPGRAPFRFVGGHRLWAAPEVREVTYEPDDRPCAVTALDDGVRVEAPADGVALVKALEIRAAGGGWLIDHELRNDGDGPITLAPWAITQLRPGGRAELPLGARDSGPQADRSLVLWPYTDLDDPRLTFAIDRVEIDASPDAAPGAGPLKVGASPGEGRLSYHLEGEVFEKRVEVNPSARYPDRGAAVQVFVREDFCELETLGPLRELEPGGSATHRETWTLREETR